MLVMSCIQMEGELKTMRSLHIHSQQGHSERNFNIELNLTLITALRQHRISSSSTRIATK